MASFARYNTHVRIVTVGPNTDLVLPVSDLVVKPEPYTGSGQTVTTLFDGRRVAEPVTWGFRVSLTWDELRGDLDVLRQSVNALVSAGTGTIYLERTGPATWDPTKVLTQVVPELTGDEVRAVFEGRARKRPAALVLVTRSQATAALPAWLSTSTGGNPSS